MKTQQSLVYTSLLTDTVAATTVRTANLDTQNADYATIVVNIGAELNTDATNVTAAILESDDTVVTNFATFDADHQRTITNTSTAIAVFHVDLIGRKRYLRLSLTPDTTTNGPIVCAASAVTKGKVATAVASGVSLG